MKTIYILIAIFIISILTGCATSKTSTPANTPAASVKKPAALTEHAMKKNPITVAFYTGASKPEKPYIVLGKETVSKYNKVGIKRQEAHIRDAMRHIAATLGGDAVINISHDANSVTGTIIAYKDTNNKSMIKTRKI